MAYPNLKAEMGRFGITYKEIAKTADVTTTTLYNWFKSASDTAFPISKAKLVRDVYFPGQSLDYLFADEPIVKAASNRGVQLDPSGETV